MRFFSAQSVSALAAGAYFVATTKAQVSNTIECSGNAITVTDATALIDGLRANPGGEFAGLIDPLRLNSIATGDGNDEISIFQGSVIVTLTNEFLFESTSVSFESLALSIEQIKALCCDGQPSCIGGVAETKGDTGLILKLMVVSIQ